MGTDERTAYVATNLTPSIHNIEPDDVSVQLIRDRQVSVGFRDDRGYDAGALFIAGDTDRQRLANLLAIAARIRQATLDLIAALADAPQARSHTSDGRVAPLPDAAPLHGTTTTAVTA